MNIIFIPFAKDNPYQKVLADSLRNSGINIIDEIGFSNFSFTFSLIKTIGKNWKPDILHFHWLDPFMFGKNQFASTLKSIIFILDMMILKLLGIRIIWTVHNLRIHDSKYIKLDYMTISFFVKLCNGIIVHTTTAYDRVIKYYGVPPTLITVIPHGNYIKSYKNNISRINARNMLGIPEKEYVYLYFGKIRPYKGLGRLIEIFNEICQKNQKLIIAGKAINQTIASDIKNRCLNNQNIIPVISFIHPDDIQIYMNAADVVVLPYKKIFTSGTVLLAMSFGKAIIAPSTGSIPDILDSNGSFLYDPKDPNGLKKAMENSRKHDLVAMGKYNLEKAKMYDWNTIAKMTCSFYKKQSGHLSGLAEN